MRAPRIPSVFACAMYDPFDKDDFSGCKNQDEEVGNYPPFSDNSKVDVLDVSKKRL